MSETSDVRTSAGSTLMVFAGKPVTYDEAGFKQLQFVEVAEITDLGEFGREYSLVNHAPLKDRRVVKRKGSFNEGSLSLPMARSARDAGQRILTAASLSDDSYSYCIRLQDGSRFFFTAQCMSFKNSVGGGDSITGKTAQLEIDGEIIEVAGMNYELKYVAGPDGSIQGDPDQVVTEGGSGTPVFAQAEQGFAFQKWSDNKTNNPRIDTGVKAAVSVTATFAAVAP